VAPGLHRPGHVHPLPADATIVLFTDGLIEDRRLSYDDGLAALARTAAEHAHLPPRRLCEILADRHPADGRDDIAVLALRTPAACPSPPTPR
jgi:hypothetical protein